MAEIVKTSRLTQNTMLGAAGTQFFGKFIYLPKSLRPLKTDVTEGS
jgi:hypothetical protein